MSSEVGLTRSRAAESAQQPRCLPRCFKHFGKLCAQPLQIGRVYLALYRRKLRLCRENGNFAGAAEGAGGQFGHHALTLAAVLAVAGGGFMAAQASLELWLNAIN